MSNRKSPARKLVRFFGTPKGLLLIVFAVLLAVAVPHEGVRTAGPGLLAAVIAAALVDAPILRYRKGAWEFPDGAILTAIIVAMVLRSQEKWQVTAATAIFAVISKYLVRSRSANVFNPAALALVASYFFFHTGQSWWGALPEVPLWMQSVLVVTGVFIADRVNKMPLVLTFLGTYFALFTAASYFADPRWVSEIFRSPDAEAALYFAFIILTDPPTSPARYGDQIIFGVIVAIAGFTLFEWAGFVCYLLAAVLIGNVWEAWRRIHRRSATTFPVGISYFFRELTPWREARGARLSQ